MAIELKVPEIGESITEAEIGDWLKKQGETVKKDDPVVTLESEKATVDLPSPGAGVVTKALKHKREVAKVGEVIGCLEGNGEAETSPKKPEAKAPEAKAVGKPAPKPDRKAEEPRETKVEKSAEGPR